MMSSEELAGMVCGAESISDLVEEKLGRQIPHNYPNRTWVLDQLRRQFDDYYKGTFGEDDGEEKYPLDIQDLSFKLSR